MSDFPTLVSQAYSGVSLRMSLPTPPPYPLIRGHHVSVTRKVIKHPSQNYTSLSCVILLSKLARPKIVIIKSNAEN